METSSTTTVTMTVNKNDTDKCVREAERMQIDSVAGTSTHSNQTPPRVPSPMILVSDVGEGSSMGKQGVHLTPTRERKKSGSGVSPRQRKRSQPVRGELLPDPDKLLSYKHHDKKVEEELEDPTVPGGQPKPPEPRQPGQAAERKRSTVTFCPVIETIEK